MTTAATRLSLAHKSTGKRCFIFHVSRRRGSLRILISWGYLTIASLGHFFSKSTIRSASHALHAKALQSKLNCSNKDPHPVELQPTPPHCNSSRALLLRAAKERVSGCISTAALGALSPQNNAGSRTANLEESDAERGRRSPAAHTTS